MSTSSQEALRAKINSFQYWHYPFDLGNGVVIKPTHGWLDAAQDMSGGELNGLRVLDVGCNAGFWSLEAYKSGAASVVGVDATSEAVAQAQLVRDALDIDPKRLEYRQMSIYDLSRETVDEFDLCLVFRVLHHLTHPFLAMEIARRLSKLSGIDITLAQHKDAVLLRHSYDLGQPFSAVGEGLAVKPSRAAVEPMLNYGGFTDVTLVPSKKGDVPQAAEIMM